MALELGNVQIFHRRLDVLVSQKVFQGHNIHTVFEQMRGVRVPKRVRVNFLFHARSLGDLLDSPLYASLRIPIVKIASCSIGQRLAIEEIVLGFFGFDVLFEPSNQVDR